MSSSKFKVRLPKELTVQLGKRKCNKTLKMEIKYGGELCFVKGRSYTQVSENSKEFVLVNEDKKHHYIPRKNSWAKHFSEPYMTPQQKEQERKRLNKLFSERVDEYKRIIKEVGAIKKSLTQLQFDSCADAIFPIIK